MMIFRRESEEIIACLEFAFDDRLFIKNIISQKLDQFFNLIN